jgi:YD repeat-containing protein
VSKTARLFGGLVALGLAVTVAAASGASAAPVGGHLSAPCPYPLAVDGWSPDGKYVAFEGALDPRHTGYYDSGGIVGIVSARGDGVRILSQTPFEHRYDEDSGAVWAPDGRSLIYTHSIVTGSDPSGEPSYGWNLVRVNLMTGKRRVVRGGSDPSFGPHGLTYLAPKGVIVGGRVLVAGKFDEADWSPDGRRLAIQPSPASKSSAVYDALVLVDRFGRHPRRIARGLNPAYQDFVWAPNGRRLAYVANDTNLFIANADGSRPVRLTRTFEDTFAWSPSGQRIAYVSGTLDTPSQLVVARPDGSKRLVATTDAQAKIAFAWSPDGRRIAYTSRAGDDLYIASADGTNAKLVTTLAKTAANLLWSPDGKHLLADGALIDVASTSQVPVSGDAGGAGWSHDSSLLAEGAGDGLQLIRADGSPLVSIHVCKP